MSNIALFVPILALIILVFMVYMRFSPLIVGPVSSLVIIFLLRMPVIQTLTGPYMEVAGSYFIKFFLIFLTGAIFGKIMEDTGAAVSIGKTLVKIMGSKRAILVTVLITAVLTYGGVSLFVVIFVSYPLALSLFKEANISKKLIGGSVALGAFTFTMTTPGTPQIQNIIPMKYLGTPATAGFLPGWIGGLLIFILGILYLEWQSKRLTKKGKHFDSYHELKDVSEDKKFPNFLISILPSIFIIFSLNILKIDVVYSLTAGILLAIILLHKHLNFAEWRDCLNKGAVGSTMAILNTAAVVGFGGVVKATPVFDRIVDLIKEISINPYYFPAISTTILSGFTGSASGGLGIAYEALNNQFINLGINMEAIHRISAMSAGTLDSLPHCGAVITLLVVAGLTHADSYKDIFIDSVIVPLIAVFFVVVPLCMVIY